MKHFKMRCQMHKIGSLLLSSRCMTKYMKTCSFLLWWFYWINQSGWEFKKKKKHLVKNSFIEKTYVVGTHWNCLVEAIPMWIYNICYWKQGKLFGNLLPSIMSIDSASFKQPKLPISIKIPVTLLQLVYICITAISPNSSSWTIYLLIW